MTTGFKHAIKTKEKTAVTIILINSVTIMKRMF